MFQDLAQGISQARRDQQLYFAAMLSEQTITECFGRASQIQRSDAVYSFPAIIWMFLSQVLSADHSCRETVARLNAWRAGRGESPGSSGTGRYCTMRDQLNEAACQRLVETTARGIDKQTPTEWHWQGHRVRVVDGTTVTMPDTPENQSEYPQQCGQKPGCGQPIMRLVALFSLASGVVLRLAMGPYRGKQTGENSMFREHLAEALDDGDVLLADRCFSGWFDIALLQQRGVEIVVRKHQLRHTDFRCGARLASGDHLVKWYKPLRPEWMKPSEHDALPEFLVIREVRIRVPKRGFRTREIIVVTTLWHHEEYPASAITELYRRRWDAEINLRSLKTHMQMDHLRCKKPHRVRNEVRMHVLAYNLIRGVMLASAIDDGVQSWQISFKGTVQILTQFLPTSLMTTDIASWIRHLLQAIAAQHVGNRPDRVEPRVRKRRPKPYKLMNQPRHILRKRLPVNGI